MKLTKQLSVFLINQPGRLSSITSALAREKINITALTLMDSTEHGVLRLVTEDPDRARKVLAKTDCPVTETDVLYLELPNRPGAFASIAEKLAREHINIDYAYCTSGAPGGKTIGIFKVPLLQKAMEVLKIEIQAKQPERHLQRIQRQGSPR